MKILLCFLILNLNGLVWPIIQFLEKSLSNPRKNRFKNFFYENT